MRAIRDIGLAVAVLVAGTNVARSAEPAPASSAPALSEDECRAIWNTAAGRSDLGPDGAKPYIDSFESVDANRDKKISNAEFKAGCKAGFVHKFRGAQ